MVASSDVNFGFVIDNRKCIGCHACTVACKSEHNVSIGVNRTHVKYIEKGTFPNTSREFSVHRCNHCEDAPCVEICPTMALFDRKDGIVDFDKDRCIGCRSCMHACPYDALYIDPNTSTAAKCNYCAHRVETNFEPACVIVCPVEAIIPGNLKDPDSKISKTISENTVKVRKPEKKTIPNVFYVDTGDEILNPTAAINSDQYLWSEQANGVGHYAKFADGRLSANDPDKLIIQLAMEKHARNSSPQDQRVIADVISHMKKDKEEQARRVYDSPSKGVLWGWEVPAYIWTKAISSGVILMAYALGLFDLQLNTTTNIYVHGIAIVFLALTGGLLVSDLDRPDRFLYVLFRPNWNSWLVRGAYIITAFGGLCSIGLTAHLLDIAIPKPLLIVGILLGVSTAVYTAFLLGQAKARDLWSSKTSSLHMLIHAIIAGAAVFLLMPTQYSNLCGKVLLGALGLNFILVVYEAFGRHPTADGDLAAYKMTHGKYAKIFYTGLLGGTIAPSILLAAPLGSTFEVLAAILVLVGIYCTEFVRIRTPQLIPLS